MTNKVKLIGLLIILAAVLAFHTIPAYATDNKHKTPPPPPKLEQQQGQAQGQAQGQQQQATATIGDIINDNSNSLQSKLDAFNNQVNHGIDYLDCAPTLGQQEIDGVSHSVATLTGCIGYEDFNDTGAATIGISIPFISRETRAAYRTKAREVQREADNAEDLREMRSLLKQLLQENRRLGDRLREVEQYQSEK
jgi:hypothetical protein